MSAWRHLPTTERYRIYSRVSLQVAVAIPVLMLAVGAVTEWAAVALVVIGGVAVIGAVEFHPRLASRPAPPDDRDLPGTDRCSRYRRPALIVISVVVTALWLVAAVVFRAIGSDSRQLAAAGLTVGFYGVVVLSRFRTRPWLPVLAVAVASVLIFAGSPSDIAPLAAVNVAVDVFIMVAVRLTVWTVQVIDDLERAKSAEARLRVAEERLRFSRDLHDVVGRGFSAIEGTTNIVKHSAADEARLILGSAGITLRNNGIQNDDPAEPSGLRGLAERLDTVGATLDTSLDDGWFGLHIRWDSR